jgi:hypothetical protein
LFGASNSFTRPSSYYVYTFTHLKTYITYQKLKNINKFIYDIRIYAFELCVFINSRIF